MSTDLNKLVDNYFNSPEFCKLKYLDLVIPEKGRVKKIQRGKQDFILGCWFSDCKLSHKFHTDSNPQLNTIIDFLISHSFHLESELEKIQNKLESFNNSEVNILDRNNQFKNIIDNLDYIKSQTDSRVYKESVEKFLNKIQNSNNKFLIELENIVQIFKLEKLELIDLKDKLDKQIIEFDKQILEVKKTLVEIRDIALS